MLATCRRLTLPNWKCTTAAVFVRIALAIGILVVLLIAGSAFAACRRRRKLYAQAVQVWTQAPPGRRAAAVQSLLDRSAANGPAWYLLGCARLWEYRTKQAARAFGMAHHADSTLETAALLTFACLKAADGADSDFLEQITSTWQEMNEPDLLRRKHDRLMLSCLEAGAGKPPSLSPLGRLAWLTSGPALRAKLENAVATDDPRWNALRNHASDGKRQSI